MDMQGSWNNVSMSITKGAMTALVGHSGSGKSTIASLLLRLYDPGSGRIIVNGRDLLDYDMNKYRYIVGYVWQAHFVFYASIRENILFGGEFSDTEVIQAAKSAHAHEFIMDLPDGYDTMVGDQESPFPAGRTNRYCPCHDPRPEFFNPDEATSFDNISYGSVESD